MAFRWRADDGTTLNAGFVDSRFSRKFGPVWLKKPICLRFLKGSEPSVSPTPLWIREKIFLLKFEKNERTKKTFAKLSRIVNFDNLRLFQYLSFLTHTLI